MMTESSDATKPSAPATEGEPDTKAKPKKPKGKVEVFIDRCKACGNCIVFCPKDVLTMTEEYNERGYHYPCVSKPEDCTGCKLCELLCGEFAIFVQPLVPKRTAKPKTEKEDQA